MTDLYLVRHAIAEEREIWAETGKSDKERPLTPKGIQRFERGARGLLLFTGGQFEIFTSPYVRADQTAAILQKASSSRVPKRQIEALAVASDFRGLCQIFACNDSDTLIAVGHEPDLSDLATFLASDAELLPGHLKKGSALKLSFKGQVAVGSGKFCWYLEPRALRDIGDSLDRLDITF